MLLFFITSKNSTGNLYMMVFSFHILFQSENVEFNGMHISILDSAMLASQKFAVIGTSIRNVWECPFWYPHQHWMLLIFNLFANMINENFYNWLAFPWLIKRLNIFLNTYWNLNWKSFPLYVLVTDFAIFPIVDSVLHAYNLLKKNYE